MLHFTSVFLFSTVNLSWPNIFWFMLAEHRAQRSCIFARPFLYSHISNEERGVQIHPVCITERLAMVIYCPCNCSVPQAGSCLRPCATPTWMGEEKVNCPSTVFLNPVCWGAGLQVMAQHREDLSPHLAPWQGSSRLGSCEGKGGKRGSFPSPSYD